MSESPGQTRSYTAAMGILRFLIRVFFQRVEVDGLDNVPADRGGLLVAWHPNGLIDPSLIVARSPGRVVFGARHGLLQVPVLGAIMRALGTVPIYRASDAEGDEKARRAANRTSLDALAGKIVEGRFSALFPEGLSHDAPHLMELKTGAARLYYRARQLQAAGNPVARTPTPVIIPVGLHYDYKHAFRSRALVRFHTALDLPADLDVSPDIDEPDEVFYERARRLTGEIERGLVQAVLPTESWEVHSLLHRGRKLIRAERAARAGARPERPGLLERQIAFSRIWTGYRARQDSHADEVGELMHRVAEYDADLTALGLEDHELDRSPRLGSPWLPLILIGQVLMVYILLPPILVIGVIVNLPPAILTVLIARRMAGAAKDEASLKIIIGSVVFPIAWVGAAASVAFGVVRLETLFPGLPNAPLVAGILTALFGATGGVVALRYRRLSRETMRALRVRFTRRRRANEIERLREERAFLCDRALTLGEGLDLPGEVAADGRVI